MTYRDIEFLYEIGTLKNTPRAWAQFLGPNVADNAAHSFRVAFIALMLARSEKIASDEKILKMALVHDLAETRISDHNYISKVYVKPDEERAAQDLFKETLIIDLYSDVLSEYETRKSIESKIVKDADNLDVDFELKELEGRAFKHPQKWSEFRRQVRDEKLYTASAKKMWDEIQQSDPASWHLVANKWLHIPEAGK